MFKIDAVSASGRWIAERQREGNSPNEIEIGDMIR